MTLEKIEKYFKKLSKNNIIGHAYLFSNANYKRIESLLTKIISNSFFYKESDINNDPNVYIIKAQNKIIKKEQILELENEVNKTSLSQNIKVYIIDECDKLNDSSANSLLKTLEEPGPNVHAILLTENLDKVIPTIKSRCQIINCENCNSKEISEEESNKILEFIKKLESKKENLIVFDYYEFYKSNDKDKLEALFIGAEKFYNDCLKILNNIEPEIFVNRTEELNRIINLNNCSSIIKKLDIINKNRDLLETNASIGSLMDKFLIEFGRIK